MSVCVCDVSALAVCVADGCSLGSAVHSVTISLRHLALGVDPTAAFWDFDLLDGHGGWRAEGCHITGSGGNTTTIRCSHHNNFAVLMVSNLFPSTPAPSYCSCSLFLSDAAAAAVLDQMHPSLLSSSILGKMESRV